MARQINVDRCALVSRVSLDDAACALTVAMRRKMSVSQWIAGLISRAVRNVTPNEAALLWAQKQRAKNLLARAKADAKTRSGAYRKLSYEELRGSVRNG